MYRKLSMFENDGENIENMRFSALQDDECGVGCTQDQLPTNIDESMAATTDDVKPAMDNSRDEGSMISNLPLLFANGYPTSLEKITLTQLERFITFMVRCSLDHDTTEVITEPQWWPKEVKFSNPLVRPRRINESWMANLKKLVFRCYTYHRSEYLLRFCSYLARYPHEELEYVNNWDSTTSLYHKATGKLLVTFRNENMHYDKRIDTHKRLLSRNGVSSSSVLKMKQQPAPIMVQPPTDDIYLCDNCDAEFIGLEKMKEHELTCCEQGRATSTCSRPFTPEVTAAEPELKQDQFLEYFKLSSITDNKPVKNSFPQDDSAAVRRASGRVRGSISFTKCPTIPFSSPAGIVLAKKSKIMTEETQQERLERVERHIIAPALNKSNRPKWLDREADHDRWVITHKPSRDKPVNEYVHQYKFYDSRNNKPMLSIRSQLLYCVCRPVYVALTRLTEQQVEELKRNPSKYQCPVRRSSTGRIISPSTSKPQMNLSSKRKASEDENSPILVDDHVTIKSEGTVNVSPSVNTITNYFKPKSAEVTSFKNNTINFGSTKAVTVINLCSSDEEEDLDVFSPSDENKDPLNSTDTIVKKTAKKLPPSKIVPKPCIYPTDSTSDSLTEIIQINIDNENYANKRLSNVILNTCTHFSPIHRPAS